MLSALDYLCYHKLIHRDIKPDNILYNIDDRGDLQFQLADFGLATRETDAAEQGCGTLLYMAPELHMGYRKPFSGHSTKADIWSLYITMMWVLDIQGTRDKFDVWGHSNYNDLLKHALHSALVEEKLKDMRNMAIFDPIFRAGANQMLVIHGRHDLLTLREPWPHCPDRFQDWMDEALAGERPYSEIIIELLGPTSGTP